MDELLRLDELMPRQFGLVERVEAPDDDLQRLMSMGVCAGRTVQLVQRGDPLILKVFGSRVGVSARLARRVLVAACDVENCPLNILQEIQAGEGA